MKDEMYIRLEPKMMGFSYQGMVPSRAQRLLRDAFAVARTPLMAKQLVTIRIDMEVERRHLVEADRHIATGARLISEQEARVKRLK